jgi:hypothetical protein
MEEYMEKNQKQQNSVEYNNQKYNEWLNTIFNHNEMAKFKWGNWLNEFLWLCAGANRKLLRQCPTEHAKYAGIGGTIFFTAIMASLSGGYAIYKVFADELINEVTGLYELDYHAFYISLIFGAIWGLLIFNLDRFMVNTMYSDGTEKITPEEWRGAFPRLILAIFIGVVISTPIELRIFKDKIQAQLIIDQGKAQTDMMDNQKSIANQILALEAKKKSNNERLDKKRFEQKNIEDQAYKEATGHGLSGKAGIGNYTKQLQERAANLKREADTLEVETKRANAAVDIQLAPLYDQQHRHIANNETAAKSMKGFAAELNALNEITFKESSSLSLARILIMFLFVAIEIIPTLFKLMMIDGAYDGALKAEKHRMRLLADQRISDINDNINTEVQISTEKNKQRLEAEILANKELMEKIAKTQAELLNTAIEKWREEELAKINESPSAYIKTNNAS